MSVSQEIRGEEDARPGWYASEASAVARELGVEPEQGLTVEEAASRLRSHGPNRLAGAKKESGFQAFVRQYRDFMQIILLAAAAINLVVTGDVGTSVVLAGLTVFNAVIGLRQEAKAEESVKALAQMMKTIARVRRGGQAIEIDAEELVPGDVVLVEAGNRVPADGRIWVAATLEIEEAALTGESLPAVETLGSTSVICSDKTGTLTLNKMTARELAIPGQHRFTVSGEGYSTDGEIRHVGGLNIDLDPYLLPMILCADAVLDGEDLIGDPTEGALIVLAAKGGLDIEETRSSYPRIAEVPFDSDYKFMATFHQMTATGGEPVVRCYLKGAPDVLISRGGSYRDPDGSLVPITDQNRPLALEANDRMAEGGERVMVVAQRDLDPATFDPAGDLLSLVHDLTLLAMAGIVDPPRSEAKAAIAECRDAGIRVRMITGDHATTAGAIAGELGIQGRAITGAEFAAMSDNELLEQLPEIGVVARVAPEDKLRMVRLLKKSGNVVAMTGDGVNDAPALKSADIGVAMGITGTEVSKEAAVMILTDDDFATIVNAVEYGRALYDNLLKYLRFQMSCLVAYIATFIGAGIFAIAGGVPLNPLQILWINFVVDVPIAVALGFDEPTGGLMGRPPRPVGAPVLSRANWVRLCVQGFVMTVGALAAYQIGDSRYGPEVAATMLLTTLSLFHVAAGLLARDQHNTIFSRDAIPGPTQLRRYAIALLGIIAVTTIGFLQQIFGTVELSFSQWSICIGIAVSLVIVEELIKLVIRQRDRRRVITPTEPALSGA
jgi:Ca2+-transporting ATPase